MIGVSNERALWLGRHVLPHEPMMRTWLSKKTRGSLEIDDIIQETYAILAALESVDGIRNPRNYAFQTAFSVIQSHLRRARVVSFLPLADVDVVGVASEAPSPEREASGRDELRFVERHIRALPKNCRDVITLRRIHELSHREISSRLGLSEHTVEKLITKAVHLLMDAFAGGGEDLRHTSKDEGRADKASER